jgi:zinc transport system substrate-binding protein
MPGVNKYLKIYSFQSTVFFIAIFALALCAGCSGPKKPADKKLLVVTSIFPVADIIRNVGGDLVDVRWLVGPGQSPHTFEPLPRDMVSVSHADVIALVGFNFEFWADKLLANIQNPNAVKLVYADFVTPIGTTEEENKIESEEGHPRVQYNPHIWLSPKIAIVMAEKTRDALSRSKPDAAAVFASNCKTYVSKLKKLDGEVSAETAGFKIKSFVAFHSAWVYLARDYGLEQAAVIQDSPGKDPTPEQLARLVDKVRALRIRAIFSEPQFNPKIADVIASEAGVKVATLDPNGGRNIIGRDSYISLIRFNLNAMKKVMR